MSCWPMLQDTGLLVCKEHVHADKLQGGPHQRNKMTSVITFEYSLRVRQ